MRVKASRHCSRHLGCLPLTLLVIAFGPRRHNPEAVVNLEHTVLIATIAWSLPIFAIVLLSIAAPFMGRRRQRGAHRSVDKLITYTSSRGVTEFVLLLKEVLRRRGGAP